jgi:hypothetical protein
MSRHTLKQFYLRALADEDPVAAQYYFQKMQAYDEALALYGKEAAQALLPKVRVRRKGGRLALNRQYLDALKAGDSEKAAAILNKIATRDRSGMADAVEPTPEPVLMGDVPRGFWGSRDALPQHIKDEFARLFKGLR